MHWAYTDWCHLVSLGFDGKDDLVCCHTGPVDIDFDKIALHQFRGFFFSYANVPKVVVDVKIHLS